MWNLSEVRQSRGSVPFTRATRLESISIERVNWRSMPTVTWHRSFLSISSEFRGNAVEPRYIFERRILEKLGSSHEVDVEMRRVSVIQITFHWHASLRLRSLLSFRLLSTRERKARAIFLFPSSFFLSSLLLLLLFVFHPHHFSLLEMLFRALDPQLSWKSFGEVVVVLFFRIYIDNILFLFLWEFWMFIRGWKYFFRWRWR